MPASEGQFSADSGFNGDFATLNSYFRRGSALEGQSDKFKAKDTLPPTPQILHPQLLHPFRQDADYLQSIHVGSDRTSFEEDKDTETKDHRSYVFSSCKFSDESHIVIGSVKTEISTSQQASSNYKYHFDKAEFKDRTKVVSGDMDGETYQKCVNNNSAT